jgi:hypothetical protein
VHYGCSYNNRNQHEIYYGARFVPKSLAQNNHLHKFVCCGRYASRRVLEMNIKNLVLVVLAFMSVNVFAENSILDRAMKVQSKLEVLNNLGRDCEAHLQVDGMKGAQSEQCEKYLRNIQGEYFTSLGEECVSLSNWYEDKRKMIIANPGYPDKNPNDAARLVKELKAVQKSCNPGNMAGYTFLTKPLDTINALSELE